MKPNRGDYTAETSTASREGDRTRENGGLGGTPSNDIVQFEVVTPPLHVVHFRSHCCYGNPSYFVWCLGALRNIIVYVKAFEITAAAVP